MRVGEYQTLTEKAPGWLCCRSECAPTPWRTRELKVGDIKPATAIDDYLIKEYPNTFGTMIYIAITARSDVA